MSTELLEWRSDSGLIVNCNFLFRTFVASIIFTVVVVVVAVVVVEFFVRFRLSFPWRLWPNSWVYECSNMKLLCCHGY